MELNPVNGFAIPVVEELKLTLEVMMMSLKAVVAASPLGHPHRHFQEL